MRLWNSKDRETTWAYKYMQRMESTKQSGPWSSLGNHGYYVFLQWFIYSGGKTRHNEILTFKIKLTLKVKVNQPQN